MFPAEPLFQKSAGWLKLVALGTGDQEGSQRGFVHLSGCISDLDEANSRFTVADENHNLASFSYADCQFSYESMDVPVSEIATRLPELTGQEYEELALMLTPTNAKIAIYKVRE